MSRLEWLTAREISECPPFNGVVRTISRRAEREEWKSRKRQGKGGGREYHISSLPAETRRALRIRYSRRQQAENGALAELNDNCLQGDQAGRTLAEQENQQALHRARAFNALGPQEQARVRARFEVLAAWETYITDFEAVDLATRDFTAAYNSNRLGMDRETLRFVPKVSRSTLMRWRHAYATRGPAGLAAGYRAGRASLVDTQPELKAFAEGMLAKMPHTSPANMLLAIRGQFDQRDDIRLPSRRALTSWMANWKTINKRLFTAVSNPDGYKNKYMVAAGDAREGVERLNQLWEMDSSPADVMCTDGRFSLISCVDVYSGRAVMTVRRSSDSWGVALTLRAAILAWGLDGEGEQIVRVDNGRDYASHYIKTVSDVLGIKLRFTQPFSGEQKPFVERLFKTFAHGIVELLPGYIGHSVAERQQITARFSFADRLKRKSGSRAIVDVGISSTDLQKLVDRWLHIYMHQPHTGLNGETPASRVQNWLAPVRRINDERALDLLLEPIPGNRGQRTVQKKGIKLDGGWYIAPELGSRVGDTLTVRYDTADAGRIYLFEDTGEFAGMAENPSLTGVSRKALARAMKEEEKTEIARQKKELKALGRKIDQGELVEKILARQEREIAEQQANVTALPGRSQQHSTDYLTGAADALSAADEAARQQAQASEREQNPDSQMQQAMSDYMKDASRSIRNKQTGKLQAETPYDRMRRWILLNDREQAGETLSEIELRWKKGQETTTEWQGHKLILDEFGRCAFGLG